MAVTPRAHAGQVWTGFAAGLMPLTGTMAAHALGGMREINLFTAFRIATLHGDFPGSQHVIGGQRSLPIGQRFFHRCLRADLSGFEQLDGVRQHTLRLG